jgi:hypothetical protein
MDQRRIPGACLLATTATLAMSSNRKTMDADKEFEMLKIKLIGSAS